MLPFSLHPYVYLLPTTMTSFGNSADFVLDEGLDDDEDILAFQAATSQVQSQPEEALSSPVVEASEPAPDPLENRSVIIDGLSLKASRADVNRLVNDTAIECLRLRRLESHRILRVYVKFEHAADAELALSRDGSRFMDTFVSIKPASEERWNATLPTPSAAANGMWLAWMSAKAVAEKLEHNARQLGESLEKKLQVSEKMSKIDEDFQVREKLTQVAKSTKETTSAVDEKIGFSRGVSTVLDGAGIVAKEVDENFRVGETARGMANSALRSEWASVFGKFVSGGGSKHQPGSGGQRVRLDHTFEAGNVEGSGQGNPEVQGHNAQLEQNTAENTPVQENEPQQDATDGNAAQQDGRSQNT